MTANGFLARARAGERPVQAWMWSPSVLSAEIICAAGYDSIGIDLQHGAVDFDHLYALMAVMSANGVEPMVRIPSPSDLGTVTRVLDGGARGVICPDVDSAAAARAFAEACKYAPLGTRGFGPVRPGIGKAVGYSAGADAYDLAAENGAVMAIVQIESAAGLEAVDEIVALDAVDGVFPGPMDLGLSLYGELVTDLHDPRIREPLARIAEAAHAAGKLVGLPPLMPANIPLMLELGADWLQMGNDVAWITAAAGQTLAATRQALADATG